jgi:metal-sulfur cluster biosynthetic enzyme
MIRRHPRRLRALPGVERVDIEIVWEPWTREHISAEGLKQLRGVGVV